MDKNEEDKLHSSDEITVWEAFFTNEQSEEWELEKQQRRKRKRIIVKIISSLLVVALLISGLEVWFNVFNIPAIRFVEVSNRLSKQDEVQKYKQSVVMVEWDRVKGTGFIIAPDGLIVTNAHVVEHTDRVNIHTKTEGLFTGRVVVKRPELDLAIVKIDAIKLPALRLSFQEDLESWQGENIIFVGNPLSFTQIANEGTIIGSVVLKDWDIPVIMIEAPVYKGNSGSPVINQDGEVIAILFATVQNPTIETKETIGAAIPAYYLKQILLDLNITIQ
jgi:serine protease Do